ncbi:hypothetical protein [Caballeronia hypogeia]
MVALVAALNVLSFCMIAIGPETAGIDMNRIDSAGDVVGESDTNARQATY